MSLQGSLCDFPVADVFQMVAQQRKTGVLEIERQERKLQIYFLEGEVLRARPSEARPDAALGSFILRTGLVSEPDLADAWHQQEETLESLPQVLLGQDALSKDDLERAARLLSDETIFELFLWDDGRFAFNPCAVSESEGDALVCAEMVLLDALRMRDEWAQIQNGLSDLTQVVAQSVDIEVFKEHRAAVEASVNMASDELERLFTLCDGRLSARRIIDLSRLGTFQGARGLVAMLREGLLHPAKAASGPDPASRSGLANDTRRYGGVWMLAGASALAGILLVLPSPRLASHPMPTETWREMRRMAEVDRIRLALESHRWRTGAYPVSIADLDSDRGGLLAGVGLDRYSYSRSQGGYTLKRN